MKSIIMHFCGQYSKVFQLLKVLLVICTLKLASSSLCTSLPGTLNCTCDALKVECTGIQTNVLDIQDILTNFSSVPNVIIQIVGLQFEPTFKFENISIQNLTLGYGLRTPPSDFLLELGPSLVSLNLNNNSIEHIDNQLFLSLSSLTELNLDFNELIELEASMFANLISLKYLSVVSNILHQVASDTFQNSPSFHTLVLSHNNITAFKNVDIKSSSLFVLKVDGCLIKGTVDKDTFANLPNLEVLDLSFNVLSEVKPHSLPMLKNLQYLNLSHNAIEFLQENAFFELNNLTSLDLKANKISLIKRSSFAGLLHLKYLDLSGNRLKAILCEYTTDFAALERIDLRDNEIKGFTTGALYYSPLLKEVGLTGNNLECSCELTDTAQYLIENSTMPKDDLKSVFCTITSTLGYMSIIDYKSSKCIPEEPCKKLSHSLSDDDYDYDYSDDPTNITIPTTLPTTLVSTVSSSTTNMSTSNLTSFPITITTEITTQSTNSYNTSTVSPNSVTVPASTTVLDTTSVEITSDISVLANATNPDTTSADVTSDISILENSTTTTEYTNLTELTTITLNENLTDPYNTIKINLTTQSRLETTPTVLSTSSEATTITTEMSPQTTQIPLSSNVTTTTFLTTTQINHETTPLTILPSSDETTTIIPITNTAAFTSSVRPATVVFVPVTSIASTSKPLCSNLELSLDSLSSDPEIVVMKNFSYDGNIFCLKWTLGGILPPKTRCVIKYTFINGTKSENLSCPTLSGEVMLWSKKLKIYSFCFNIYAPNKRASCAEVSKKTTPSGSDDTTVAVVSLTPSASSIETTTLMPITNSAALTSSEMPTTEVLEPVTSVASTSKPLCSDLELNLKSLSSNPEIVVIKNFSYDGNIFCLKWTLGGIFPSNTKCTINYSNSTGKYLEILSCPKLSGEVKLWSMKIEVYKFCFIIHAPNKTTSCAEVSEITTPSTSDETTVSVASRTPTGIASTQTSTVSTEKYTKAFINAVSPTEASTIVPIIRPFKFNVTSFDVSFNDSSFAYATWTVNMEEPSNLCNLTLTATTQYFDHNEGVFPCKKHTHQLRNVREDEIFKLCLVSQHESSGYNTICRYSLAGANLDAEATKSKDDTNYSSSLIPLICLLVLLVLILIFVIYKNISKKRQESDRYDVRAEEEKSQRVQIRPASSQGRSSVRYSYVAKENPDS